MRLFALNGSTELGEQIASSLGCKLPAQEERSFEDAGQRYLVRLVPA
ncbi:hypothetical protein [Bradyrhizobium sp. SZCCHNRI1073]|nr:hypothetical protein [Bradyrhizobium sp. SZCCHNRI1073]